MFKLSQNITSVLAACVITQSQALASTCPADPYKHIAQVTLKGENWMVVHNIEAHIILSSGQKIVCKDVVLDASGVMYHAVKNCDNGSSIQWVDELSTESGLIVTDKNKSMWKMNAINVSTDLVCTANTIQVTDTIRVYQDAFSFTLQIKGIYGRKGIPSPAGF
jgi:hypothetical protein